MLFLNMVCLTTASTSRIKKYAGLSKQELQSNYEVVAGTGKVVGVMTVMVI
jgi:hypothetical protein